MNVLKFQMVFSMNKLLNTETVTTISEFILVIFMFVLDQSDNMTNKWHVYMTKDGRISLAGLSAAKCEYLADAIIDSFHNVH